MRLRHIILSLLLTAYAISAFAQWADEYKMEIGGGVGLMSYQGDFNGNITKSLQPVFSVVARRVLNPYMGFKANISYGTLKGSSRDVETHYPDLEQNGWTFNNNVYDAGITYEYNFLPYGTGKDYRGAKRFTPFVFLGIGATLTKANGKSVFAANLPLGCGVKYKVATRLNLGLEWAMHFCGSDKLDGVVDPYYIKSSGLFKNRDGYSVLQVTLTYSFLPKCKTCNKDNDD